MAPHGEVSGAPDGAGIGWSLGVLVRAYRAAVDVIVAPVPHGPRGYEVLAAVVHGNQPSQLALAAHLGMDRTVMTYLIDDLVEAGLVERRLNPLDRRARKIIATGSGVAMLTDLERRVRAAEDTLLLRVLDDEGRANFRLTLSRVALDMRELSQVEAPDPSEVD